tara:strand:- start:688 stop:852 length:165 start_codon:yes stop_codon:yes gene_type:complete
MMGDSLNGDIAPAVSLGMQAVWLDRSGKRSNPDPLMTASRSLECLQTTSDFDSY